MLIGNWVIRSLGTVVRLSFFLFSRRGKALLPCGVVSCYGLKIWWMVSKVIKKLIKEHNFLFSFGLPWLLPGNWNLWFDKEVDLRFTEKGTSVTLEFIKKEKVLIYWLIFLGISRTGLKSGNMMTLKKRKTCLWVWLKRKCFNGCFFLITSLKACIRNLQLVA